MDVGGCFNVTPETVWVVVEGGSEEGELVKGEGVRVGVDVGSDESVEIAAGTREGGNERKGKREEEGD